MDIVFCEHACVTAYVSVYVIVWIFNFVCIYSSLIALLVSNY